MTEVIPVTGRTCSRAHLHADLNTGLTELLDLETGEPAAPGALGTARDHAVLSVPRLHAGLPV